MTTEVAHEGESSAELPAVKDVVKELTTVRQHEGLSPRRIESHGKKLQQLRISQHEFRRVGSEPGTLPMATVTALECAVRFYHPESIHALVLGATLNIDGKATKLSDRQADLRLALGIRSPTTYEGIERDVYNAFGFRIRRAERSFCRDTDVAAAIDALPQQERIMLIRLLLGIRVSDLNIDQDVSASELLRLLPGLWSIESFPKLRRLTDLDDLLWTVFNSKTYKEARKNDDDDFSWLAAHAVRSLLELVPRTGNPASINEIAQSLDGRASEFHRSRYASLVAEFPGLSRWSQIRLRVRHQGLFFDGAQHTPSFEWLVCTGLQDLARLLVEIDKADHWGSVLDAGRESSSDVPPEPSSGVMDSDGTNGDPKHTKDGGIDG
ncbi:hypothetical protein [Mycolicibacterium peregrinum]|uniref:hypothetical protein n=1 Tax=Mycolicibacterium peregrinum TaxID=43304 RepID=UPI003AADD7D2